MGMDYRIYIETRKDGKWSLLKPEIFEGRMTSRTGDVIDRSGNRMRIETHCCDFMRNVSEAATTVQLGDKYSDGIERLVSVEMWDKISPSKRNGGEPQRDYTEGDSLHCISTEVTTLAGWKESFIRLINDDKPDADDIEAMARVYAELLRRVSDLKAHEAVTDDDIQIIILLQ